MSGESSDNDGRDKGSGSDEEWRVKDDKNVVQEQLKTLLKQINKEYSSKKKKSVRPRRCSKLFYPNNKIAQNKRFSGVGMTINRID